jgi:hypothetical protein
MHPNVLMSPQVSSPPIQFQNGGTPLGVSFTVNCSTGMSCSFVSGVMTMTATGGGGSGTVSGQTTGCYLLASSATASTSSGSVCDNGTTVSTSEALTAGAGTFTSLSLIATGSTGETSIYSSTNGISASQAYVDCSVFTGADDSLKIQACFAALKTLNATGGVADARGLTGLTWSVNPFAAANIPARGMLLLPAGTTVVQNVPVVGASQWLIKGVYGVDATILQAGSAFPVTYSTGTITVGTAGASDVITGVSTAWSNNSAGSGNIAVGCGFVSPAGGLTGNSTYGIISAITSATSITLAYGVTNGTGAPGGSTYDIYCPVFVHGDGSGGNGGYEYGISAEDVTFDANNKTGVVPEMNWFGAHPMYSMRVQEKNFCSLGLDIEGKYVQNSYFSDISAHPGTCGSTTVLPVNIRVSGGTFGGRNISQDKGADGSTPAIGIEIDGTGAILTNANAGPSTVGIEINGNTACIPACPYAGDFANGQSTDIEIDGANGAGTTLVTIGTVGGNPVNITLVNLNSYAGTNLLIDNVNSCTIAVGPEYSVGEYVLDVQSHIGVSTSNQSGCQASPTLAGVAFAGSAPAVTTPGTTPYLNLNTLEKEAKNTCTFGLTTSTFTLALSPVSLCAFTLPNAAVTWAWTCQMGWSNVAGTTPTFATGVTWAHAPSAAFQMSNILTSNLNVGTELTTATTTNANILATGTLTPAATIYLATSSGTFTASATSGTFSPTISLTGTGATGTAVGFCYIQ